MGEVDFLVENSGYVLPIEIKSGKAQEDLRYNHAEHDYLLQVTPDIPCAFVFGETNISDGGSKIWYYPIYLLPFLKKERWIVTRKIGTPFSRKFLIHKMFSFIPVLKTSKRHIRSLLIRSISNRQCPPLRTRYEYLLIRLSMILR